MKDLGVSVLSPRDASKLHSELRAAQVNVVASRMKWAALLKEADTVSAKTRGRAGHAFVGDMGQEKERAWAKTCRTLTALLDSNAV